MRAFIEQREDGKWLLLDHVPPDYFAEVVKEFDTQEEAEIALEIDKCYGDPRMQNMFYRNKERHEEIFAKVKNGEKLIDIFGRELTDEEITRHYDRRRR